MAYTLISHAARITDLATGTVVAAGTVVAEYKRGKVENAAGTALATFNAGTALANTAMAARGGAGSAGTPQAYFLEVSEDGGTSWPLRMPILNVQQSLSPPYGVTVSGSDVGIMLDLVGEDRVTFVAQAVDTILYNDGSNGLPKGPFRNTFGKPGQTGAHLLQLAPAVDPTVLRAGLRFSVDIDADLLGSILQNVCQRIGGSFIQGASAPPGSYGNWGVDPKAGTVTVAHVSVSPVIHLTPNPVSLDNEATTAQYIADSLVPETRLDEQKDQISLIGGQSDHGMPDGGQITCRVLIDTNRGAASSRWDDNLPVFGISTGGNTGGVFFWVEGAMRRWSQAMDVYALAYDPATNTLYAATSAGIRMASAPVRPGQPWQRVGGLAEPCADVAYDGGILVTQVGASSKGSGLTPTFGGATAAGKSSSGIYMYPAVGGDTSGTAHGYDSWSRITDTDAVAMAYRGGNDMLLVVSAASPDAVDIYLPTRVARPHPTPRYTTGHTATVQGVPITDITLASGGAWCVGAAGSRGLYYLPDGGSLLDANADNSLKDSRTLAPVAINRVRAFDGLAVAYVDTTGVARTMVARAVACTAGGLFASPVAAGGNWRDITSQTGLADQSIVDFAAGADQTILTHQVGIHHAITQRSYYRSPTRGQYYRDELAMPLDMGPFWQALAAECGQTPYADPSVGALGTLSLGAGIGGAGGGPPTVPEVDTGGSGTTVPIPPSSPRALPLDWIWARRLDKLNNYTYRLVCLASSSAAGGIEFQEVSHIQADSATPAIAASEELAVVAYAWLAMATSPMTVFSLETQYHTTASPLGNINTGDMVSIDMALTVDSTAGAVGDGVPTALAAYSAQAFYVLSADWEMTGYATIAVHLKIGSRPGEKQVTPDDIAAALVLGQKRQKRFRRTHRS